MRIFEMVISKLFCPQHSKVTQKNIDSTNTARNYPKLQVMFVPPMSPNSSADVLYIKFSLAILITVRVVCFASLSSAIFIYSLFICVEE